MIGLEREVLEMVAGKRKWILWGAALGACLEFLKEGGYITNYTMAEPQLTEKGKAALEAKP